jgi:hypothetical protein
MEKSDWIVFNNWDYPISEKSCFTDKDWGSFDVLFQLSEKRYEQEKKEIFALLDEWNQKLLSYGGEPAYQKWGNFRPLRLEREEDWSDWLAHLIDSSKTGYFARVLFNFGSPEKSEYLEIEYAERESSHQGYRGDLVIKWKNGTFAHVEVKIGDPNLEKTYPTAREMRAKYRANKAEWHDFILLLDNQLRQWLDIKGEEMTKIRYLTWNNVAISIRKSILFSEEAVSWKVWAYSYLGAIEQKILKHPHIDVAKKQISNDYILDSMLGILKEGMKNER